MRRCLVLAGLLVLSLIVLPMLRHASAPSPTAKDASISHAPRSAPAIARIAATAAVTIEVPRAVIVAAAPPDTEPGPPMAPTPRPVVPLRL
jgi:hypothetical protein